MTLTCEVQSFTTPNVNWMSDTDVTLPSTSLVSYNDVHTSVLILEQVTLEYIGAYNCTAENEEGEMSDVIYVDVYGKNVCIYPSTFALICQYNNPFTFLLILCVCVCLFQLFI